MVDRLLENDGIVEALQHALSNGEHGLKAVPLLVIRVIEEQRWTERKVLTLNREVVAFQSFIDFVTKGPPMGLGTDLKTLKRLCADDRHAADLIDQVEQSGSRPGERTDLLPIIKEVPSDSPHGTTAQYALRRLRKDRPDLHQRVLAGECSPHAAMVEAGFRPKTVTVPATVDGFIRAAQRHLTADERRLLIDTLDSMDEEESR